MRAKWNKKLILTTALAMACEFVGVGRSVAATPIEDRSTITICVHNYANVAPEILEEAKEVTGEIFRKTGVETRWSTRI